MKELLDSLKDLKELKLALDEKTIVAITDSHGIIKEVNDKFCQVSGYTREELLGKTHRIVNSGEHPKEFFTNMWVTISAGKVWRETVCNRNKNGCLYWVDTSIIPFRDEAGDIYKYVALRNEVTELVCTLDELHESERYLDAVFESVKAGIIVLDSECIIRKVNTFACMTFAVCNTEVMGKDISHLLPMFDKEKSQDSGTSENEVEIDINGETRYLSISVRFTRSRDKDHYIFFVRNITEQKKVQENISRMQHELDAQMLFTERLSSLAAMASGIAHELNQPLSGIRVYAEMIHNLLEDNISLPPERQRELMTKIIKQVDRMAGIIEHMREFSSDRKERKLELQSIGLKKLAEHSFDLIGAQLRNNGVEVFIEIPENLNVLADAQRLEQVFINLLSNARDAIADSGNKAGLIRLTAFRREDGEVELHIADNGSGVPDKVRKRLFEPFVTSKDPGSGTGLGLAICHRIINDFKAQLSLLKTNSQGTTFRIVFSGGDSQ